MNNIEKIIERLKIQEKSGDIVKPVTNNFINDQHDEKDQKQVTINNKNEIIYLDKDYLKEHGFLTEDDLNTKQAEEYRVIKRPLLMNAFGKGAVSIDKGNIITILSALPGEGKTFTAMNLAISLAMERNTTILLIDSDVTKPSLTKIFNMQAKPGLLDLLMDENLDIGDVISKTNIPKLRFIPAGKQNEHAAELLASRRMKEFVKEISERYHDRIILFDAPPMLATSHSSVLAQLAGQILLVVESGKTLHDKIIEALSFIDNEKVIGLVLNKSRKMFAMDYYGSYGEAAINHEEEKQK